MGHRGRDYSEAATNQGTMRIASHTQKLGRGRKDPSQSLKAILALETL
jgi:hypothetical protein